MVYTHIRYLSTRHDSFPMTEYFEFINFWRGKNKNLVNDVIQKDGYLKISKKFENSVKYERKAFLDWNPKSIMNFLILSVRFYYIIYKITIHAVSNLQIYKIIHIADFEVWTLDIQTWAA